ncbi:MAG: hypothetical protein ACXWKG_08630 [Limisphaerales bacterium]
MKTFQSLVIAGLLLAGLTIDARAQSIESFGCTNTLQPGFTFQNWPTNAPGSGADTGSPVNVANYEIAGIVVSGTAYNTVSSNRIYLQPVRSFTTSPPGTNILGLSGWETNNLAYATNNSGTPGGVNQLVITPPTSGSGGQPFVFSFALDSSVISQAFWLGLAPNSASLTTSNGVNFATGSTQVISNFVVKVTKKIRPIRYP